MTLSYKKPYSHILVLVSYRFRGQRVSQAFPDSYWEFLHPSIWVLQQWCRNLVRDPPLLQLIKKITLTNFDEIYPVPCVTSTSSKAPISNKKNVHLSVKPQSKSFELKITSIFHNSGTCPLHLSCKLTRVVCHKLQLIAIDMTCNIINFTIQRDEVSK